MQPISPARVESRARHRLVSPAALVGLVALVGAALVLVFPAGLVEQIYRYGRHDELSATYIGSLLHADPGNRRLRLTLVERLLEQGDVAEARQALAPLRRAAGGEDREIRLLDYRLLRAEADRAPGPAEAARARDRARRELARLAALDWEPAQLARLAEEARALGVPELAARLYRRLADIDAERAGDWTARAAQTALATGDYRATVEAYLAAAGRVRTSGERRDYVLKAIKTLQSGNLLGEALALADAHLADLAGDDAALLYLVRLARAANDPARAQAYAKLMLHMSGNDRAGRVLVAILGVLIGDARAAEAPQPDRASGSRVPAGMRPYDEEKYALAYDVFLAARNLEDAYRVAAAAVAQVPGQLLWRQRLAQVAEWTGRAPVALEQWRFLAAHAASGGEREQAWQAVLRLAPAVRDDEAVLAAWLHEADTQPMDAERWRRIAESFERVGRAAEGAAYFQRRYEKSGDEELLGLQAYLQERTGRDDEAIAAYLRLIGKHGVTDERLQRAAVLMLRHNRFREAFELLDRHRGAVDRGNAEFWDLFADLAWKLQQDQAALEAYQVVTAQSQAGDTAWLRLVELTRERDPAGASRIAALGYERLRTPALLVQAAELHWQRHDLSALRELYGRLTAEDEKRMANSAYFFALRAQFRDADGNARAAEADFRRAIAIEPGNPEWVASLLWHFISRKEPAALRHELAAHAAEAREARALWEVYAAAYAVLGDVPRALSYYARLRDARREDYLWLLNYADVLDQGGQAAMALRVRRHAWQVMRARLKDKDLRSITREELEAVARMTLAAAPGDPALRLVGRIVRQDFLPEPRGAGDRTLDAGARELVLSWALSTERYEAAKAWLWQQYARQLARPAWAELSIALAENDRQAVERLLAADADALPVQDRIEAARATDRLALAQSYAFDAQDKRGDDDDLHLRLTETLLESANALVYRDASFERGVLKGREQRMSAWAWITGALRLAVDLGMDSRLASTNPATLAGVPDRIEQYAFGLRWRHEGAHTDLHVGYRNAVGSHEPVTLFHTRDFAPRLSGVLGATHDEVATETIPLYLDGMRDRLSASLTYRFSLREYLTAEAWAARYHTQDDTYLGRGRGLTWEIGHRFRTEYPDWRVRLTGSHQGYTADGSVDAPAAALDPTGGKLGARYFIPESFDLVGVYATFGDTYRDRYSRAFRLYADVGPTWNSKLGEGFLIAAGAGGSVFGHDRLVVYFNRSKGGSAIGGFTAEAGVRYEYLFDR